VQRDSRGDGRHPRLRSPRGEPKLVTGAVPKSRAILSPAAVTVVEQMQPQQEQEEEAAWTYSYYSDSPSPARARPVQGASSPRPLAARRGEAAPVAMLKPPPRKRSPRSSRHTEQNENVESGLLLTQLALASSPATPTPEANPLLSLASSASSSSHLGMVTHPAAMAAATTMCGDLLRLVARMLDER
jgi:hypothetical protein